MGEKYSTKLVTKADLPIQITLALFSGALVRICLIPQAPVWLPFLALVPFALALGEVKACRGWGIGWLFGSTSWFLCTWWTSSALCNMLAWPAPLAWLSTIVFALWQGLPYALGGFLIGWLKNRGRKTSPLFIVSLLTVLVALRPSFYPGSMALLLAFWPEAIQTAEWGGSNLVLFLLLLVNWSLAAAISCQRCRILALKNCIIFFVLLSGILGYGSLRLLQLDSLITKAPAKSFITVTSIQPSVALSGMKDMDSFGPYAGPLGMLVKLTEEAAAKAQKTQLILWPEIPGHMSCECDQFQSAGAAMAAQSLGAPIMATCVEYDFGSNMPVKTISPDGTSSLSVQKINAMFNAVWLLDPNGNCASSYHKTILMPFGERTPLREIWPWIQKTMGRKFEYSPGPGAGIIKLKNGLGIQPLLCLEAGYPRLARQGVELGARAFAGQADELWFSSPLAAKFQLGASIFRTVEFRRPMVRCTNSGLGAHIRATGSIVPGTLTSFKDRTAVTATMHCPDMLTPFARGGDTWLLLPGLLALLTIIFGLLAPSRCS